MRSRRSVLIALVLLVRGAAAEAQSPQPAPPATTVPDSGSAVKAVYRVSPDKFAELRFSNRPILVFRAALVPRQPAERAEGALRALERLVENGITAPVEARPVAFARVVTVGGEDVFAIVPDDLDTASNEDLPTLTDQAMARLRLALAEAAESRQPARLVRAAARSLLATVVAAIALFILIRVYRRTAEWLITAAESRLTRWRIGGDSTFLRASRLLDLTRGTLRLIVVAIGAVVVYSWLTYVLQQFPLTRPWGEALGGFLLTTLETLGWNALQALPGIFTVVVILIAARFVNKLFTLLFEAIEQSRIQVAGLSGPALVTTRRLVKTAVWLFAIGAAYPYLPGSQTEAFKGLSILVGLGVSLGSGALINQIMSGFVITYGNSLRPGEYVRVGDVEGTVTNLGVLATKVRTRRNEEVTIPNTLVIAGTTMNFSRNNKDGVYAPTAVTIGYDAPWRQVEAMMLEAAERTRGVRRDPAPFVIQTNLGDFAVEYTLAVCLEEPAERLPTLARLRAHIQDAFNEHGVQIMSPHYETDPEARKVVPRERWFTPPATEPNRSDRTAGASRS